MSRRRLHPDQRRLRLFDQVDSAAFWTCIGVMIGIGWLLVAGWSSF
jgi:hypothetical protein